MFEGDQNEQLRRDLRKLGDDIAQLRRDLSGQGRASLEQMRERAREQYGAARDMAQERARDMDRYVHEKPWAAVGVAAAIGAVIGALMLGRGRRQR